MEKVFNLDFHDMFFDTKGAVIDFPEGYYSAERLEALIEKAVKSGFSIINYRAAVNGRVSHHSEVKENAVRPETLKRTLSVYDPAPVAIKAAHKYGAKCYIWITPYDDGDNDSFRDRQSEFSKAHPEFQLQSFDGKDRILGEYCFGYQEVKDYFLAYIKELLEYKPDGIFFSNRTHSNIKLEKKEYGFNAPVIERYKELYGEDPREEKDFELVKFSGILGDFYTDFLREAAELIHVAGAKVMQAVSWQRNGLIAPRLGALDKCFFQWEHWLQDEIVDELIIGGDVASGFDPEHILGFFETEADSCNPDYFRKPDSKAKIYRWITLFSWGWNGKDELTADGATFNAATVSRMLTLLKQTSLDGILCHEAWIIQNYNLWNLFEKEKQQNET